MLIQKLIEFRERFHPLHRLRQCRFVARRILPLFDQPLNIRMRGVAWPVRVRRMRHMSYVIDNRLIEPGVVATFRAIQALIRPKVFWDVGANVGFYSWLLMNGDPNLSAVLFEPDPDNLALLRATITSGELRQVTLVDEAVSDRVGQTCFVLDADTGTTSHLEAVEGIEGRTVTVSTTTLDRELGRLPTPDFVKIDVEGSEALVLAGASRLLREVRPVIVLECFGGSDSPPIRVLSAAGYNFANADDPGSPIGSTGNYLCLPGDAHISIAAVANRFEEEYKRWIGC